MATSLPKSLTMKPIGVKRLDYATLLGAFAAFGLVFIAIAIGGGVTSFFDIKGLLIVIGGTVGATLINFPIQDFRRTISVLRLAFFESSSSSSPNQRIRKILDMSRRIRATGVLTLENDVYRESDPFLRKCMALVVDGHSSEEISEVIEIEISFLVDRHRRGAQLFQTMGTISPAMGLIGTLIGLVQMLQNLDNPSQIGPAMAVALLTTFYGAVFANLIFLPLAGKLKARSEEEARIKTMTLEGVLGLAEGLNPRLIEQRLIAFLPPEQRSPEYEQL